MATSSAALARAPLPEGWEWDTQPSAASKGVIRITQFDQITRAQFKSRMKKLQAWINEHEIGLQPWRGHHVTFKDADLGGAVAVSIWGSFQIKHTTNRKTNKKLFGPVVCRYCNTENAPNAVWCEKGCWRTLYCRSCGYAGITGIVEGQTQLCGNCTHECGKCKTLCSTDFENCGSCERRAFCAYCGVTCQGDDYHEVQLYRQRDANNVGIGEPSTNVFCSACIRGVCGNCSRMVGQNRLTYAPAADCDVCSSCMAKYFDEYKDVREDFEPEELPATKLVIPNMDGRDHVREVGIEIEGGGDGDKVAKALQQAGYAPNGNINRYHTSGSHTFPVHIEADASVDWEMVIQRFNPSSLEAMRKVNGILKVVRDQVKAGDAHLDLRCGCHIHVDAHKVGVKDAFNLDTLFAYVEDPMFRLSAAKWNVHRAVRYGAENGAACPVPKGPFNGHIDWANKAGQRDRYAALNFQNFWAAIGRGNCVCGALRYGAYDQCTCNLGKCTFEFRVFNSTLNPRKLHAYIAISQALVAKAISLPEIKEGYEPQEWVRKPLKAMSGDEIDAAMPKWAERVRWMFNELPLTSDEKESLLYCVKNSDLSVLGDVFFNDLNRTAVAA